MWAGSGSVITTRRRCSRSSSRTRKNVIAKTFEQVSLKDILSAVAIIRQSRKIYVVGSELVTGLCAYTTRRLLTLGLEALDLSNLSRALYNNYLAHATPEDCAIIFSAPGYAKHIVNTARYLDKKKIPQIAITDQRTSPIASYGTTIFTCNNHDLFFYNSVMGYMSVANALIYLPPWITRRRRINAVGASRKCEVRSAALISLKTVYRQRILEGQPISIIGV